MTNSFHTQLSSGANGTTTDRRDMLAKISNDRSSKVNNARLTVPLKALSDK